MNYLVFVGDLELVDLVCVSRLAELAAVGEDAPAAAVRIGRAFELEICALAGADLFVVQAALALLREEKNVN